MWITSPVTFLFSCRISHDKGTAKDLHEVKIVGGFFCPAKLHPTRGYVCRSVAFQARTDFRLAHHFTLFDLGNALFHFADEPLVLLHKAFYGFSRHDFSVAANASASRLSLACTSGCR